MATKSRGLRPSNHDADYNNLLSSIEPVAIVALVSVVILPKNIVEQSELFDTVRPICMHTTERKIPRLIDITHEKGAFNSPLKKSVGIRSLLDVRAAV